MRANFTAPENERKREIEKERICVWRVREFVRESLRLLLKG